MKQYITFHLLRERAVYNKNPHLVVLSPTAFVPLITLNVLNVLRYKCFYKSFALFHRSKLLRITKYLFFYSHWAPPVCG